MERGLRLVVVGAVAAGSLAVVGTGSAASASPHASLSCRTQVFTFKSGGATSIKVGSGKRISRAGKLLDDGRAFIGYENAKASGNNSPNVQVEAYPFSTRTYTGETRITGFTLHLKSGKVVKGKVPANPNYNPLFYGDASSVTVWVGGVDDFGTKLPVVARADFTVKENCFPKVKGG